MLVFTAQIALSLLGTQGAYSGFPGYSGPSLMVLGITQHRVTGTLNVNMSTIESFSRIKNYSEIAGEIQIMIPNNVRGAGTMGALQGIALGDVKVLWDGKPLPVKQDSFRQGETNIRGMINFDSVLTATAQVKSRGTHELSIAYNTTLTSIKTPDLCTFAYDTQLVSSWRFGPIGEVSISLRYAKLPDGQSAVFGIDVSSPKGWQYGNGIGPNQQTAYFGASNFLNGNTPNDRKPITLSYWGNTRNTW
jgi:hypothetical protein